MPLFSFKYSMRISSLFHCQTILGLPKWGSEKCDKWTRAAQQEQVVTGMSQRREDSNGVKTSLEGRRETHLFSCQIAFNWRKKLHHNRLSLYLESHFHSDLRVPIFPLFGQQHASVAWLMADATPSRPPGKHAYTVGIHPCESTPVHSSLQSRPGINSASRTREYRRGLRTFLPHHSCTITQTWSDKLTLRV